jgi:hypothetical protein
VQAGSPLHSRVDALQRRTSRTCIKKWWGARRRHLPPMGRRARLASTPVIARAGNAATAPGRHASARRSTRSFRGLGRPPIRRPGDRGHRPGCPPLGDARSRFLASSKWLMRACASNHSTSLGTRVWSGVWWLPAGASTVEPHRLHTGIRPFVSGVWCASSRAPTSESSCAITLPPRQSKRPRRKLGRDAPVHSSCLGPLPNPTESRSGPDRPADRPSTRAHPMHPGGVVLSSFDADLQLQR